MRERGRPLTRLASSVGGTVGRVGQQKWKKASLPPSLPSSLALFLPPSLLSSLPPSLRLSFPTIGLEDRPNERRGGSIICSGHGDGAAVVATTFAGKSRFCSV